MTDAELIATANEKTHIAFMATKAAMAALLALEVENPYVEGVLDDLHNADRALDFACHGMSRVMEPEEESSE